MQKQLVLLTAASFIALASSSQAQSQTPGLSNDFGMTDTVVFLPPALALEAGYPQWRLVTMNGRQAVPYNYCTWLIDQKPWTSEVFGVSRWQAVENCAAGISAVTRVEVDESLPLGDGSAEFWRSRPEGYQYMVPDYDFTQAQFQTLVSESELEGIALGFVTDPQSLSEYLVTQVQRIQALEDWRQSLADSGGVVTQEALESWASQQGYLKAEDLPEEQVPLSTQEVQDLVDTAIANLPAGFSEEDARGLFVLQADLPDAGLTQDEADDLYQAKGEGTGDSSFVGSFWWWVFLIAALLAVLGILLGGWSLWQVRKSSRLAGKAMRTAKTAVQLGLPIGWEAVKDWPEQKALDKLEHGQTTAMEFVHDDGTKKTVEFTAHEEAFPQNEGKKKRGLAVSGQATSTKPVACRVGMLIRECCKALEGCGKHVVQPKDPKTGKFVKVKPAA